MAIIFKLENVSVSFDKHAIVQRSLKHALSGWLKQRHRCGKVDAAAGTDQGHHATRGVGISLPG